jgi:hypothetical protein
MKFKEKKDNEKPGERKGIKKILFSMNISSNKVKYLKENNTASVICLYCNSVKGGYR